MEKIVNRARGGDGIVFGWDDDLVIGSIRAQTNRLKDILSQMENDEKWKDNRLFYSRKLKEIEKALRKIRKRDFELAANF